MAPRTYTPPPLMTNGHIQTAFPVLFRNVQLTYTRERIDTFDNDFLDLDWSCINAQRLAVISHGLEGDSQRQYVLGMARALNRAGWDVLAWNYRSCSGVPNKKLRSYHNGATDDLAWVIDYAKKRRAYTEIALVGFSLGGNLTLVHLGRDRVDPIISRAVVFSVPCDLTAASATLAKPANTVYMKRFLRFLHEKIKAKMEILPGQIDDKGYEKIKTFKQFDDRYTAPIHGFKSAEDYWEKCSSRQFIPNIKTPCLIVNAVNDPFLPHECFPVPEAGSNPKVTLEMPKSGGHVGFVSFNADGEYWSEQRAVAFLAHGT